ncbi:MAG: sugar kinase [Candidatus Caenarcaniphilales bacterium]|nr:sugar kinase [Candidatus Caenarcaniphilales bacterium]
MNNLAPVLVIGELMVDLISREICATLDQAQTFDRFQGGSVANFAFNLGALGNEVRLISAIGEDSLGNFLKDELKRTGIDICWLQTIPNSNTSLFLGTRTNSTPDFMVYRGADYMLSLPPKDCFKGIKLYHTSAMSISLEPARGVIIQGAKLALESGAKISLDLNYSAHTWKNRIEAQEVILSLCALSPLIKFSADDGARLFPDLTVPEMTELFMKSGAELACCTLGENGSLVSFGLGKKEIRIPGKSLAVYDVTGAGDAYWAGFVHFWLKGESPEECASQGAKLAEAKITIR